MKEDEEYSKAFNEFADGENSETTAGEDTPSQAMDSIIEDDSQSEDVTQAEPTQESADDLIEKLEAEVADLQHRSQSDAGRVSALQKKNNELVALINERNTKEEDKPFQPETAPQDDTPPPLVEFKDDYPDIYQGVEAYMRTELEKRTRELEQRFQSQLAPANQLVEQQQTAAEFAALEAAHPDWQQIATTDEFGQWVQQQPPAIQAMANSDYSNDVSFVLSSFKAQSQTQQPQASGISRKREMQLAQSASLPSRGNASASTLASDDYESAFNHYAAKRK